MTNNRRPFDGDDADPAPYDGDRGTRSPTNADILRMLEHLNDRIDQMEQRVTGGRDLAGVDEDDGLGIPPRIADPSSSNDISEPSIDPPIDPYDPPPARHGPTAPDTPRRPTTAGPDPRNRVRAALTGGGRRTPPRVTSGDSAAKRPVERENNRLAEPPPHPRGAPHGHRSASPAAEPVPTRRRRGVIWLFLLIILIGAGAAVWVSQGQPTIQEIRAHGVDRLDRLLYGPPVGAEAGNSASAAQTDDGIRDDDNGNEVADVVPASTGTAVPEIDPDDPRIEAAPRDPVESDILRDPGTSDRQAAELPDDAPETLHRLAERALAGNDDARHDLATAFALGDGVQQDLERAVYWYERASDAGVVNATYNLGVLTRDGLGTDQNEQVAARLFQRAAERNHPDAQFALGRLYRDGQGVAADPAEAARWFQAANGNGNPRGALELARLFESGIDGAPDLAAAAGWYRVAANAGLEEARERLDQLRDGGVDQEAVEGAPSPPASEDVPTPVPTRDVAQLSDADDIRLLQEALEELGYSPGPVDGIMGSQTRSAIEQFQEEQGLPVTGEPTPSLLEMVQEPLDQE